MSVATPVMDLPDKAAEKPPVNGLAEIVTGKVAKPRRVVLYGVDGIGKSTWAANAENPIFVPTEEGLNDIDVAKFPVSKSYDEFEGRLKTLATSDHQYKTVVVDSLDWLERLIWKRVCEAKGVATVDEIGYGKGYSAAMESWNEVLRALGYLRENKGMNVILLAHARVEKIENPEGENYNKFGLALHAKTAAPLIREWADEVLFTNYKVYTKSTDEGFGKVSHKAIGGDERIIYTQAKPSSDGKNRLSLPAELPLDWGSYRKHW